MTPSPTIDDLKNGVFANAEHSPEMGEAPVLAGMQLPNLNHLMGSQFRLAAGLTAKGVVLCAKYAVGILAILGARQVFKIFQSWIAANAVLMVYIQALWARTNEGSSNLRVNGARLRLAVFAKSHHCVSGVADPRMQYSASAALALRRNDSLNPTSVTDFVDAFVADNWLPYLVHNNDFITVAA
jgi:hypothetical protein